MGPRGFRGFRDPTESRRRIRRRLGAARNHLKPQTMSDRLGPGVVGVHGVTDVSGPINTRKSFLALGVNNTAWYKMEVLPFVSRTVIRKTRVVRPNSNNQGIDRGLARISALCRLHRLSSMRGARSSRTKIGLSLVTSSILTSRGTVSCLGIRANCQRTKFFPSVR